MSINIKTSDGLLKIGGKVTKEAIDSALGYTPANAEVENTVDTHKKDLTVHITSNERTSWNTTVTDLDTHTSNSSIHVTSSDKSKWDNKSDFSGDYHALSNKPNITDDGSETYSIADNDGNVIFQVDAEGTHNRDVFIGPLDSEISVSDKLTSLEQAIETLGGDTGEDILGLSETVSDHIENTNNPHNVTKEQLGLGDIVDDNSGSFRLADSNNNIAFEVSSDGITNAAKLSVGGKDIETIIEEHIDDIPEVVIPAETDPTVPSWAKQTNKPSYTVSEISGAVPNTITINGKALSKNINLSANDVEALPNTTKLADLTSDATHRTVTDTEKTTWNNKSDFSGAYVDLQGKPNITDDGASDFHIADSAGNIVATVNADGVQAVAFMDKNHNKQASIARVDNEGFGTIAKFVDVESVKLPKYGNLILPSNADDYGVYMYAESPSDLWFYGIANDEPVRLCNIATPNAGHHAANKAYVDDNKLDLQGGTITGPLTVGQGTSRYTTTLNGSLNVIGHIVGSPITADGSNEQATISGFESITATNITATDFNSISDARLKTNIVDYTPSGNILDLPLKEFDYIKSNVHTIGCLAQDLVNIAPELVDTDTEGFMSIKESKLVYLLLFELQKMNKRLDEIERRMTNE